MLQLRRVQDGLVSRECRRLIAFGGDVHVHGQNVSAMRTMRSVLDWDEIHANKAEISLATS